MITVGWDQRVGFGIIFVALGLRVTSSRSAEVSTVVQPLSLYTPCAILLLKRRTGEVRQWYF